MAWAPIRGGSVRGAAGAPAPAAPFSPGLIVAHTREMQKWRRANLAFATVATGVPQGKRYGFSGLDGNIPAPVVKQLHDLAIGLGKSSVDAWNAVKSEDTWANSKWRSMIGSDSSFTAGKAFATAQSNLAASVKQRVDKIIAQDDLDEARKLLSDAINGKWTDISILKQNLDLISFAGGAKTIAADSARDAGAALQTFGTGALSVLKYLPYIAVGVAVLYGGVFVYRATRPSQPVSGIGRSRRKRRSRR